MSIASIIDKANGIIADASAFSAGGDAWPSAKSCLGGATPTMPSFTPYDTWTDISSTRASRFQEQLQPGFIFWIGDSITFSWDVVQAHQAAKNFGINGDTLAGMLNRVGGCASSLAQAGGVVLQIGTNDLGVTQLGQSTSDQNTIKDYVNRLISWFTPGIPIAVLSPLPQRNPSVLSIATLNAYTSWLSSYCAGKTNCRYVDITSPVQDTDGYMKTSLTMDGIVHPNAAGYSLLNSIVRPVLLGWT